MRARDGPLRMDGVMQCLAENGELSLRDYLLKRWKLYSSATSGRFPAGYYTVRAFAKVTKVGRTEGTFHLINRTGNVVAKLPAVMEVHSLTIPRATTQRSFATITEETNAQGLRIRITVHCCSNGTCTITISF